MTYAELNHAIDAFPAFRTPCPGSEYPWLHRPERITDGLIGTMGIRCACGKVFDGRSWAAPVTQAAPELWDAFEQFKRHAEEVRE